ncbi:hypothetical protein Aargi30884_16550 [Amedibacterium intestinale]|uniref:Uncharacterized protein n=1 Tax=Amedibacterium intestinale TaxID=2583452 RepID=A0A6N4TKZ5_9FIRM|nr:hypothetical protein [Amedibacterium intestinale]BBK22752.1 hypothetical protein Aargi30884_16550 [Amedibacterium intestinale]
MKKRKLKKMVIGACLGIILGIILGYVGSKLSLQDTFLMITALFVCVIVISLILIDDLDAKIKRAYCEGKRDALTSSHSNCRCAVKKD